MEERQVIDLWKKGLTVQQVSQEYMNKYNKNLKKGIKKIDRIETQKYVEPIIYEYQTNLIRGVIK